MAPPPIDPSSKLWPGNNPRYKFLMEDGDSLVPLHESLKDVMKRSSFYWDEVIRPLDSEIGTIRDVSRCFGNSPLLIDQLQGQ